MSTPVKKLGRAAAVTFAAAAAVLVLAAVPAQADTAGVDDFTPTCGHIGKPMCID